MKIARVVGMVIAFIVLWLIGCAANAGPVCDELLWPHNDSSQTGPALAAQPISHNTMNAITMPTTRAIFMLPPRFPSLLGQPACPQSAGRSPTAQSAECACHQAGPEFPRARRSLAAACSGVL